MGRTALKKSVIGLAGKYCSGKNLAADILVNNGFVSIDVDLIGHQALIHKKSEIVENFGLGILDNDKISKHKLGQIVFNNPNKLKELENIVHPWMVKQVEDFINKHIHEYNVLLNAAVLHKMGLDKQCDYIIWVKAPFLLRLKRAIHRERHFNRSFIYVLKRIWSQRKLSPQYSLNHVDIYTIRNSETKKGLEELINKTLIKMGI